MSEPSDVSRLKSPPFPAITLQKAIERAEQLYRQERDHLAPLSSAAKAWGMSPTSSGPIQVTGALKQYGLIDDEGSGQSRKIRLTKDALRIVLDKAPSSPERAEAVRRCFLKPKIFAELWSNWGAELPSEQTIMNHLVLERRLANLAPFSDQGAVELLGNYRSSMGFADPQGAHNNLSTSEVAVEEEHMEADPISDARNAHPEATAPIGLRQPADRSTAQIAVSDNERVVFVEEGARGQHVKLVVSGDLDEFTLEALTNYIERQKRRLGLAGQLN